VLGQPGAGQIEVATFRQDLGYTDGRHPDAVRFSSAREDAERRDFTINGMFYDPVAEQVIDYVEGQADLARKQIRAIGQVEQRFEEDKLRMLRGVRFAATLGFSIEPKTAAAIVRMAPAIAVVSAERIAAELRAMLIHSSRSVAVQLLYDLGLLAIVLPEALPTAGPHAVASEWTRTILLLERLNTESFPLALATLLNRISDPSVIRQICQRLKLSNKETASLEYLLTHYPEILANAELRWSQLQPILVHDCAPELLQLGECIASVDNLLPAALAQSKAQLQLPREQLDPPPLLSGADLITAGVPRGPIFGQLLQEVRNAQLDGELSSQKAALQLVERRLKR